MKAYLPTPRGQRFALAAVSSVISLSLMASVLVLFSDRGLPWSPQMAKAPQTPQKDAACAAGGPASARCPPGAARAPDGAPQAGASEPSKAGAALAATTP